MKVIFVFHSEKLWFIKCDELIIRAARGYLYEKNRLIKLLIIDDNIYNMTG